MTLATLRDELPASGDYPRDAAPDARLRFAVRYAVLAPSSHNTQPWLFHVRDNHVDVIADRTRALPVADPDDRELVISCGAALHHLRTALAAFGEAITVELLPGGGVNDTLARVVLDDRTEPNPLAAARIEGAGKRATTRFPFVAKPVAPEMIDDLRLAAESQGAHVTLVTDDRRHVLAELVAEGDRAQMKDKSFRRELASWLHGNRSRHRDGMPGYAQGYGDVVASLGPFVMRRFDIGARQAAKDAELVDGSPLLIVLASDTDEIRDWIHVGEALSALLLEAQMLGLSASFLNQPIELPSLRERLARDFTSGALPQLLLRIGAYAGDPPRLTPRRHIADVLLGGT